MKIRKKEEDNDMSQYSNVKWDNEGYTFMDQDRMMTLMDQVERCGGKNRISLYDLLPDNASPMTEVPVRIAANASEYYGGMRMDGVRGSGDTICRTENMSHVYNKVLESQKTYVEDIISYAAMDTSKVVVLYDSYLINRFLDLYDQPVPFDKNRAVRDLDISNAKADYRRNTLAQFEYMGRDSVWARGCCMPGWNGRMRTSSIKGKSRLPWLKSAERNPERGRLC